MKTAHDDIKKIKETVKEKVALSDQNMEAYAEDKLEEELKHHRRSLKVIK